MAYVLGFIYADGAIEDCSESSRAYYILLSNNDYELLTDIMNVMSSDNRIETRKAHLSKIRGKEYWSKTSYRVRIGNKVIYDDLIDLGLCPRKSLVIELLAIPNQYFNCFLRGYFDGDGCIYVEKTKNKRVDIIFTSGSRIFLEQLSLKILDFFPTINSCITHSHRNGAFQLRYNWKNALMVADLMYKDISKVPYLKYKYNKYLEYLKNRK